MAGIGGGLITPVQAEVPIATNRRHTPPTNLASMPPRYPSRILAFDIRSNDACHRIRLSTRGAVMNPCGQRPWPNTNGRWVWRTECKVPSGLFGHHVSPEPCPLKAERAVRDRRGERTRRT